MFNNLIAEMSRNKISKQDVAKTLNISYNTVRAKISGKSDFLFNETVKIKRAYFNELSLEYLFKTNDNDNFNKSA
jgi:hypothetical protein